MTDNAHDRPAAPERIAFYIPSLVGHGAQKVVLLIADEFARRGYAVDVLVDRCEGAYLEKVSPAVNLVTIQPSSRPRAYLGLLRRAPRSAGLILRPLLRRKKAFMSLWQLGFLVDYLRSQRPLALISALDYANLLAIWACRIARAPTKCIVTERNTLSKTLAERVRRSGKKNRGSYLCALIAQTYPRANAIVAVSDGVGDDLAATAGIDRPRIKTVYNPVATQEIASRARAPTGHPWLDEDDLPVILGVGRLVAHKGFDTLIAAFARIAPEIACRLIILGEGDNRAELERLVAANGLGQRVCLPGWTANPFAFMQRASAFVLCSRYEGLGNALIEALGCGCPVIATDCPHGPREILRDGQFGALVAIDDATGLAAAISQAIRNPPDPDLLRARAHCFTVADRADRYLALIESA